MQTQTAQPNPAPSDPASSAANPPTKNTTPDRPQPVATKSAKTDSSDATPATVIPEPKRTLGSATTGAPKGGRNPDLAQPASAPQPTRDGQSTLTRALGLKIG